jgi:hypothetical protein
MYRAVGAGPGETVTYRVDLPLPWGRDTEVTLPIQALVDDAWVAMEPNVSGAISKGAVVIAASVALAVGLAAMWIKKG